MFKIPGKIDYVKQATIDVEISAGSIINNQTWIPATQHQDYFGNQVVPYYQHVQVKIELDNAVLLERVIGSDTVNFHHEFLDSDEQCDHVLKISVIGNSPEFIQRYQDNDVFTMLKINGLSIENLPIQYVLEQTGQWQHYAGGMLQYLGPNGSCALNFTTPIYVWLLSKDDWINKPITDK